MRGQTGRIFRHTRHKLWIPKIRKEVHVLPKTPRKQYFASEFPDICDTVSSCECTGLMPTPPTNDAERAAYETLFSMEVSQSEEDAEQRRL